MILSRFALVGCLLALLACTETIGQPPAVGQSTRSRILVMGDSLLAINTLSGNSIAQSMETALGEEVIDRAVRGARYQYILPISGALGLNILKQYQEGPWDWVVLNGGGNDLIFSCGCKLCDRTMSNLISPEAASGQILTFVNQVRASGARVIYVGYLRSPGVTSIVDPCYDNGVELERRLQVMADADSGVYFLSNAAMVPYGDRTYHRFDMVHPSVKASQAIGQRIAALIKQAER